MNKPKSKKKGKDGTDKTLANNTQQQSNQDKKNVKCWNCNGQGHYSKDCPQKQQSLSEESQERPSSSSGATGETTLSGSFLNAFEQEAKLNSLEPKTAGVLVTGIDRCTARSVVPAGEIPGHSVKRDSETGRVYTSATGERVFDQEKQQILGTVDGKVRGLNMRVAHVKKSLTSVCDMYADGHRVVFDFDTAQDRRSTLQLVFRVEHQCSCHLPCPRPREHQSASPRGLIRHPLLCVYLGTKHPFGCVVARQQSQFQNHQVLVSCLTPTRFQLTEHGLSHHQPLPLQCGSCMPPYAAWRVFKRAAPHPRHPAVKPCRFSSTFFLK